MHHQTVTKQTTTSQTQQQSPIHGANITALTAPKYPSRNSQQTATTATDPDALLRTAVFAELAGTSVSWVYRMHREGFPGFPKPIKMGARCTRWRSGDVRAFLQAQGK